jgi:hypothetical protein
VYWAHTVAGASGLNASSVPGYNFSSTLSGWTRWLRILRDRDDSDRWVLQYSADGESWTTAYDAQRGASAMPDTVRVGMAVFSDQASHGVSGRFHGIRFWTPTEDDFPA